MEDSRQYGSTASLGQQEGRRAGSSPGSQAARQVYYKGSQKGTSWAV